MIATIAVLGLLGVATATDLARHKIYNWTTYPGIVAAWVFHGTGSWLASQGAVSEAVLAQLGWIGIGQSLLGFLVCGLTILAAFVFLKVGGGDVKMIAMLGAWLGVEAGVTAMLWTFVLGGCVGLIVLVWRVGWWRLTVRALRQLVWTLRLRWWAPLSSEERAQLQPPLYLAPCALAAAALVQFGFMDLIG